MLESRKLGQGRLPEELSLELASKGGWFLENTPWRQNTEDRSGHAAGDTTERPPAQDIKGGAPSMVSGIA